MIHARFDLSYPGFALRAELQVSAHGIIALFGPSGSGKTTLLRCIAGLERTANGMLRVRDEVWQDGATFQPVHRRPLGYVFQEASVFPHLSVRQNLEYGLKRIPPAQRRVQLEQAVEWLGLDRLIGRDSPAGLSGGELQRVAIARALLTSPRLLLMDEPLSALDAASKHDILPYLERLHAELDIPVIYVSHALDEVARLADQLVLMEAGRVIGSIVRARVLARDVSIATIAPQGTSISNILAVRITGIQDEGPDRVNLRLAAGEGQLLLSRITRRSCDQLNLAIGMEVFAQVKSVALIA